VDHTITFEADSQGRPEPEGVMNPGRPDHVVASCACGHSWKLKGIRQIIQLEQQPGTSP
jgi:hypothetical protein